MSYSQRLLAPALSLHQVPLMGNRTQFPNKPPFASTPSGTSKPAKEPNHLPNQPGELRSPRGVSPRMTCAGSSKNAVHTLRSLNAESTLCARSEIDRPTTAIGRVVGEFSNSRPVTRRRFRRLHAPSFALQLTTNHSQADTSPQVLSPSPFSHQTNSREAFFQRMGGQTTSPESNLERLESS